MTIKIADVSEFQGNIDWAAYGAQNDAVIVRAHNGWRADNFWAANRDGSRAHTKWRAFYQYLPASVDAAEAAKLFAATVGPLQPGEVVVLDLEEGAGDQTARRTAWLNAMNAHTEWTYSGMWFARQHLPGVKVDWVAAYQGTEPTDAHELWQNTDKESFAGISNPCDGSVFNGSLADLEKLSGAAVTSTTTTHSTANPTLVKAIQNALHIGADGKWGNETDGSASFVIRKTMSNVRLLQAHVGAPVDGVWGPVSESDWVSTIKRLQSLVGAYPDGVWGAKSQAAWDAVRVNNFKKY